MVRRARLTAGALALAWALTGCVGLGVVGDGTTISMGRPGSGWIVDGVRLPDRGDGYFTRDKWRVRGNRFGTDELVDLITAVSRRVGNKTKRRAVIADLSPRGGGDASPHHRSHQNGRDVDILFFYRDASGSPVEPDDMREFDPILKAKDKSGLEIDVPQTWQFVRELLTAPEAAVVHIFMYQPLIDRLLDQAAAIHEPDELIARARQVLKHPVHSLPHNDHMHVRILCAANDRPFGCSDPGTPEIDPIAKAVPPIVRLAPIARRPLRNR